MGLLRGVADGETCGSPAAVVGVGLTRVDTPGERRRVQGGKTENDGEDDEDGFHDLAPLWLLVVLALDVALTQAAIGARWAARTEIVTRAPRVRVLPQWRLPARSTREQRG